MTDFWSFLLQTLTASGMALLLLAVKAMFRNKLSPRWQFSVWGVLGLVLLLPAGLGGRYALVNWLWVVETMKSLLAGEYSTLTRVYAPVPLPQTAGLPKTVWEWLYMLYLAGLLLFLLHYILLYLRLRRLLRQGMPPEKAVDDKIQMIAKKYNLPICPIVMIAGPASAFICGVFRPVLVLPEGTETNEKVILHELLHLRYCDVVWGLLICFFRCIHWCNPLLWYCADQMGNDMETLCDQRVLERLEGEERREYGYILLAMTDEKYARAPGTSSMANGGKNIRRRIETIARFKCYPQGMALISICVALVLAAPVLLGIRAEAVYQGGSDMTGVLSGMQAAASMASARTISCTTPAGALDTYAKAVLTGNVIYRAMCAPLWEQEALADCLKQSSQHEDERNTLWEGSLQVPANVQSGYLVYNLTSKEDSIYEGLVTVELAYPPEEILTEKLEIEEFSTEEYSPEGLSTEGLSIEGLSTEELSNEEAEELPTEELSNEGAEELSTEEISVWLGVQNVRVTNQEGRWVVTPLEEFRFIKAKGYSRLPGPICEELPAWIYEGNVGDFTVRLRYQSVFTVKNYIQNTNSAYFQNLGWESSNIYDTTPCPDADFYIKGGEALYFIYTGKEEEKENIWHLGVCCASFNGDGSRPNMGMLGPESADGGAYSSSLEISMWSTRIDEGEEASGGSSAGVFWAYRNLKGDWSKEQFLCGGSVDSQGNGFELPACFAADLYINKELAGELTLLSVKGDIVYE